MILTRRKFLIAGASCVIGSRASAADWLPLGTTNYFAESNAIFAAFTTPPTDTRKLLINNLVGALKSFGIWALLDRFYVTAAADTQAARVDWKNPGSNALVDVSTVTFTADKGFAGVAGYLSLGANLNTLTQYTQNSASMFVWIDTVDPTPAATQAEIGADDANEGVGGPTSAPVFSLRINGGSLNAACAASDKGLVLANRSTSVACQLDRNAVELATSGALGSGAVPAANMTLCRGRNASSNARVSAGGFGASLSATRRAAIYTNCLLPYMQGVGVV